MWKKIIQNFIHQLGRQYRVAFIDEDTLSYSRQYTFRPLTVVLVLLLSLTFLVGGTAAFIIFTPQVRKHIPGYTNPDYEKKLVIMQSMLDTMQREIDMRDEYLNGLKKSMGSENPFENRHENLKDKDGSEKDMGNVNSPKNGASGANEPNSVNEPVSPIKVQPSPGDPSVKKENSKNREALGIKTLVRPVIGTLREGFSPAKQHYGVDIITNEGESVLAATEGFVILSEYSEETGHVIGISNPSGVVTFYKHNSRVLKKRGAYVYAGDAIAVVGNTGENSSGPHLHFEIWYKGEPLNPVDYLTFK